MSDRRPPSEPFSLGPRSVERPADSGWVFVGGLDDLRPVAVDGGGSIGLAGGSWSLDWWIGSDDRWHYPGREPAIRQRRVGLGPVVETSMRIPSGDAVQTVYPTVSPTGNLTVVDIRNDSAAAVAVAVAVRSHGLDGVAGSPAVDRPEPGVLTVDGTTIVLPRPPSEVSTELTGTTALLYPLPHRTSLRFVLGPTGTAADAVARVPDPGAVAKGWTSVVEASARYEFADQGITNLMGAARARLLLGDPTDGAASDLPGAVLGALAAGGHDTECRRWLVALADSFPTGKPDPSLAADTIWGAALAAAMVDEPGLTKALLEPLAQLTHLVERQRPSDAVVNRALDGLRRLLIVAGQEASSSVPWSAPWSGSCELAALAEMAEQASPALRFGEDSGIEAARFVLAARSMAVVERGPNPGLDLLRSFPTAWRGGGVEVHDAPTLYGPISFAIRWHGARPALLWDRTGGGAGVGAEVELRCPALDPEWSSVEPSGETLLSGSAEPLPAAPAEGESFG